jgi:hypothetical protein
MKWEYKRSYLGMKANGAEGEKEFNKLGEEGWELVSSDPEVSDDRHVLGANYWFKRPKE